MGGHAAQKIDDLIRGEHRVDAAHPQHRRHTDHGPGAAAEKGLQSHLVADEVHPQHGEAEVVVRPVPQGIQQSKGQLQGPRRKRL